MAEPPGRIRRDVAHLLGLDYCQDRGLPTDRATLVFRRLTRAALETDRNIVMTTDHSGEAAVPFFAQLTTPAKSQDLEEGPHRRRRTARARSVIHLLGAPTRSRRKGRIPGSTP